MAEFVFTFGSGQQPHGIGTFVAVNAPDAGSAREAMCAKYGSRWAFQYDSRKAAGVYRFNLRCVDTINADEVAP